MLQFLHEISSIRITQKLSNTQATHLYTNHRLCSFIVLVYLVSKFSLSMYHKGRNSKRRISDTLMKSLFCQLNIV